VARVPRWYRGKDIMDWLLEIKFFDARAEEINDPKMLRMKAPQLTGTGNGKKTISIQSLAKKGVTILGKLIDANDQDLILETNATVNIKFADGFSGQVKELIDSFISKNHLYAPASTQDEDDIPDVDAICASQVGSLNFDEHHIKSIIWCTGFGNDFSYIKLPVFSTDGSPIHRNGVSEVSGLYFIGIPWLRNRKSSLLCGIKEDAEFIIEQIRSRPEHSHIVSHHRIF